MTVFELKQILENIHDDAIVMAFDPDDEEYMPVSGCVFDEFFATLHTDEIT